MEWQTKILARFAAAQVSAEALKAADEISLTPKDKKASQQNNEAPAASYEGFMSTIGTGGRRR